jgi:hypothetical protein
MSLQKLKNPSPVKVVQVSDGDSFPVRGLSPSNVIGLYYRHTGQLSGLFEQLATTYRGKGEIETPDITEIVATLMQEAPLIMAELIALASGSTPVVSDGSARSVEELADADNLTPEESWLLDVHIATSLPFAVQVDALVKIGELSFTSEMPPGKFVSLVANLLQKGIDQATKAREA